jgi:UMF1 family MFS transporter
MTSYAPDEATYEKRIRAWTMYDWANSAFATTILAAVLPAYYSGVAGASLPSSAVATAYWTTTLSISLIVVALISPVLGTIADVMRGKKKLLSVFVGVGVVGTGLLILVGTGDWLLASAFFIIGRVGFAAANVFYDSLLPHVARDEDQDAVSARGYAIGYLGGGLLLAVNVLMIFVIGSEVGARLSFLSVAIWWAVFSIPIFRRVPEPPAAGADLQAGETIIAASFARLGETLKDLRQYKELFKYLIAFLIYNDGIGTIIGVAVIYGAELGFGTTELILAILLVQFVGIPFSLVFGRIPKADDTNRAIYLAFIVFNIVALPIVGIIGARVMPADTVGALPGSFADAGSAVGEGSYEVGDPAVELSGTWDITGADTIAELTGGISDAAGKATPIVLGVALAGLVLAWVVARRRRRAQVTGAPWSVIGIATVGLVALLIAALSQLIVLTAADPIAYATADGRGVAAELQYNGRKVEITHSTGPDHGIWTVEIDGNPLVEDDERVEIDATNETLRYGVRTTIDAGVPGVHTLTLRAPDGVISVGEFEVLPPVRESNLGLILGSLLVVEVLGLALVSLFGKQLFGTAADNMTTKRAIVLALVAYTFIAVWGFFLDAVIEFWYLAWMVAVVQGGSQALSRSLYSSMSPTSVSGEFFGFFSVMSKFSSIVGPVIFAGAVAIFGNSRPAVLSLIVFFIVGIVLLRRVDVDEGRRVAREADHRLFGENLEDET